jgi:O-antigen/teichoic acid export membrane protein
MNFISRAIKNQKSTVGKFIDWVMLKIGGKFAWRPSYNILIAQSVFVLIFLIADVFFARTFSKADFAVWKQLKLVISLIIPMIPLGFPEGFKYYLALEPQKKQYHFSLVFNILCLITLILFLITFIKGPEILQFFFPGSTISSIALLFPLIFFFFTINKVFRFAVINEGITHLLIIGSVVALLAGVLFVSSTLYVYKHYHWYLVSSGLMIIVCYFVSVANILMKLPYKLHWNFDFKYLKRYLKIGFPLYLASFIGIILINLDTAIVLRKDTIENFAVYTVGAIEIPLFSMISASVSQSYFPRMVALINTGRKEEAKEIWITTTRKITYITYPIILVLMILAPWLITSFFGKQYINAVPIFKTYLFVSLWRNNYYGAILSAAGKTRWITFYSSMNLLVNGVVALLLYKYYGMYGVAFSTFIATSFIGILQMKHENLLKSFFVQVLGDWKNSLLIILIVIAYFIKIVPY